MMLLLSRPIVCACIFDFVPNHSLIPALFPDYFRADGDVV